MRIRPTAKTESRQPVTDSDLKPAPTALATALAALNRRDFAEAGSRLEKLARDGQSEAMRYLGLLYLRGLGVEYDPFEAFRWIEAAAQTGSSTARLTLASLYYLGLGTARNTTLAQNLLRDAARTGDPTALRTLGLVYLGLGPRWRKPALACFRSAAADQDVFAVHAIAVMRLIDGEVSSALPSLSWAGIRGLFPSLLRLKALQNRLGKEAIRTMALKAPLDPKRPRRLPIHRFTWEVVAPVAVDAVEPRIALQVGNHLLHPVECDYLIALAAPHLKPQHSANQRDPDHMPPAPATMTFTRRLEDLVLCRLEERIATFAGKPWNNQTSLACERHFPGASRIPDEPARAQGRFRPDSAGQGAQSPQVIARVSLNDAFSGGEISFPALDRTVAATTGQGIVFSCADLSLDPNPLALWHEEPVRSGEKWIAIVHFHDESV